MNSRFLAVIGAAILTSLAATPLIAQSVPGAPPPAPAPKAPPKAPAKAPAKQPAAPAAPAQQAQPAAPAPQNGAGQQIDLVYSPWTKLCSKGQEAGAKQVCLIGKDGLLPSGQFVVAAVLIEQEGEAKKLLRVTLPLGMQLVYGSRITVDNNPPADSPYAACFPNGCMADFEATPERLAQLKKGAMLTVQAINSNGAPLALQLPLGAEFQKAYDGPPIDPKVLEERGKKREEEFRKRAEDERKRLEGAGGTAPAAK